MSKNVNNTNTTNFLASLAFADTTATARDPMQQARERFAQACRLQAKLIQNPEHVETTERKKRDGTVVKLEHKTRPWFIQNTNGQLLIEPRLGAKKVKMNDRAQAILAKDQAQAATILEQLAACAEQGVMDDILKTGFKQSKK